MASSYKELPAKYKPITSDDRNVKPFKKEARMALEAANFATAEELLNQTGDTDVVAARQMQEKMKNRFVPAAESKAANGYIQETQLNYPDTTAYYGEAAELVESILDAWED